MKDVVEKVENRNLATDTPLQWSKLASLKPDSFFQ
jgi:hypothetical protein